MTSLINRHEFVAFIEVTNGNPNGDPDTGGHPRIDQDTGHGLMTDVSIKRKIRNYVELRKEGEPGFEIYVSDGAVLNDQHRRAYAAVRGAPTAKEKGEKVNPANDAESAKLSAFMAANFFDVRAFGAVMSTAVNAGALEGPVQIAFGRSVEPVTSMDIGLTRMAVTNLKEKSERNTGSDGNQRIDNQTMGRKFVVPYGLYRVHGFVSAAKSGRTGFDQADLDLVFDALVNMFDHDHSAARAEMATRRLIAFKHASVWGNANAYRLFDLVTVGRNIEGATVTLDDPQLEFAPKARKFSDYVINVDTDSLPVGVEVIEYIR